MQCRSEDGSDGGGLEVGMRRWWREDEACWAGNAAMLGFKVGFRRGE